MDGIDGTFRANFSIDGAAKLRERVRDKLKEFMGDYTDDTLVEYVIVLLRNGRQKQEAKNELNVFLGDDSDSFVSWLWDHLSSNLHLYVQQQESYPEEITKSKPVLAQLAARSDPHQLDSGSEREKSTKHTKRRRNREWKGLVRDVAEVPPLWSSEIEIEPPHSEEKMHESPHSQEKMHERPPHSKEKRHEIPIRMKRAHSPKPLIQNKRSRQDEHQDHKREVPSRPTVAASCRLLQFAVRDAVGTLKSSSSRSESSSSRRDPTLKRLRSVVSTSTENSYMVDQPRSVARLPSAVATAFKAAADAAEDVTKVRSSVNVFDRLGHGMDESGITNQLADFRGTVVEDAEYRDFDQTPVDTDSNYVVRNEYSPEFAGNTLMLERDRVTAYDSASDNDAYDDVNKDAYCDDINNDAYDDVNPVRHRVMDASETGTSSGNKDDDSLMVRYNVANDMQYRVANNMNDAVRRTRIKDQNPSAPVANTSRKIVNISVNVNTWKPPHYQAPKEVKEVENLEAVLENDAAASKSNVRMMENNNAAMAVNGNEKAGAPMQKESQKTQVSVPSSYSIGRPSEDADSRTIFVHNVHFAATKDTLSRHFNKFGEVLKVVIVTDAASGQPKGSAYIEFMRKEAAELALSLNGTSFMSRILKVVKKSAAYQEGTNIMTWSHIARASPFAARLGRVPFPRGMPATFRTRLPVKPGARSLQWKRDAPAAIINEAGLNAQNVGALSNNSVPSPTARSLTYVRKESKPEGNVRPA